MNNLTFTRRFLLAAAGTSLRSRGEQTTSASAPSLAAGFKTPPDSARPWVYWFWKNGNINAEAITADLEAMQRVGIGGVIIMEVSLTTPKGPVAFFSPEWRKLFTHAVREAHRLGLQVEMNSAPGWTGSGGAWITPEQSMQKVVAAETEVTGPARFEAALRQPETVRGFYRDIAVLAFPSPAGDRRIGDIAEKALYKRGAYSSQPKIRPAFSVPRRYEEVPPEQTIDRSRIADLTKNMDGSGRLSWNVPDGKWTIVRIGHTSTGQTNRPAPSEGLECDKLDTRTLDKHFSEFTAKLLEDAGPAARNTLVATHLDSWEVGGQNWSAGFRAEFRTRRGYDPLPYLPVMSGRIVESPEVSERFLWDLRQTVSEMIATNHGRHMRELARKHGLWLSIEPYDMNPADDMSLGAAADVPMAEFWSDLFDTRYSIKEAASVGHVYGRPVIAAEAFTSGPADAWHLHPASVKALGDWAYSEGINRFVIHRCVHQPFPQIRPGLSLGPHGLHYDRTQTWWELSRPWHTYLTRCQYLLRQGTPAADVLYLSPEGAPNVFQPPRPAPAGYKYDACTPEALIASRVENGRIVTAGGSSYRLLVLPETAGMTPGLLGAIARLVRGGAKVAGAPPVKSPSLTGYPHCDEDVQKMVQDLWGKGLVVWSAELAADPQSEAGAAAGWSSDEGLGPGHKRPSPAQQRNNIYPASAQVRALLSGMGVKPDFESDVPLRFAHRTASGVDIYFVSNGQPQPVDASCAFRVAGKAPELWHPESGEIRPLASAAEAGRTTIRLRFEAAESYFVVFRRAAQGRPAVTFSERKTVAAIEGPWTVLFDPKLGGPQSPVRLEQLADWTARPEEAVRFYSGTAVYRTEFRFDDDPRGGSIVLDLGEVHEFARVRVNRKECGIAWKAPYRVPLSGALRQGINSLEIEITNLWPNRMIGDEFLPEDAEWDARKRLKAWPEWLLAGKPSPTGRLTFTHIRPYSRTSPLLPSGLLGPVVLLA